MTIFEAKKILAAQEQLLNAYASLVDAVEAIETLQDGDPRILPQWYTATLTAKGAIVAALSRGADQVNKVRELSKKGLLE